MSFFTPFKQPCDKKHINIKDNEYTPLIFDIGYPYELLKILFLESEPLYI